MCGAALPGTGSRAAGAQCSSINRSGFPDRKNTWPATSPTDGPDSHSGVNPRSSASTSRAAHPPGRRETTVVRQTPGQRLGSSNSVGGVPPVGSVGWLHSVSGGVGSLCSGSRRRYMLRARRGEEFGQVSMVGGMDEEAVTGSGDRGVVGGDVPAGDGQAQEVAQEFLALPGRVDLPAVDHGRSRCWRACARACSKRAQAVAATVGDDGTSGTTGSPPSTVARTGRTTFGHTPSITSQFGPDRKWPPLIQP
jgi:hypothetical protein